jgi:hypothetical protein
MGFHSERKPGWDSKLENIARNESANGTGVQEAIDFEPMDTLCDPWVESLGR